MLIARNRAETRSSRWPDFNQSHLGRVDFSKHNVLLVADPNAPWKISIKSIGLLGANLYVTIVAPLPPPIIWPYPGPPTRSPDFAPFVLVELPKSQVTAVYGTDVRA
jgi:hypothetical protein